jgi:hypothetical protein
VIKERPPYAHQAGAVEHNPRLAADEVRREHYDTYRRIGVHTMLVEGKGSDTR